jgi:hypothetical protein
MKRLPCLVLVELRTAPGWGAAVVYSARVVQRVRRVIRRSSTRHADPVLGGVNALARRPRRRERAPVKHWPQHPSSHIPPTTSAQVPAPVA